MLSAVHNDGRTETYTYGDSEWKDLLTALDGVALTYDGSGNPLSYYNGMSYTMSWIEGRKLSSVTVDAGTDTAATVTYQYNVDGQRICKTYADGRYTQYLIADGRVLAERQYDSGGSVIIQLRYNYDENGTVCGYSTTVGGYPWTDYYFIRNLQGDVVQVFRDSDNAIVAEYSYDSWGNILTATGDQAEVNPFRYRGYYYDEETGFYYLQSRYYDPEVGRFIHADDVSYLGIDGSPLSYNLFAYCLNNPVNRTDLTGHWSWSWKDALKAATVVTIVGLVVGAILISGGTAAPPLFAALGGSFGSAITAGTATAIAKGIAIGGAVALGGVAVMQFGKKSKSSDKERSTDKPSWVSRNDVDMGKSAQQNASELLNEKYGTGNWPTGPKTEYNQIVKWINRGLIILPISFSIFEED